MKIRRKFPQEGPRARINEQIRAGEVRVISAEGKNLGLLSREKALAVAKEAATDLIEVAPLAIPPVAKVMDYGKWQYLEKKKLRAARAKGAPTETKSIQIKIATGEYDLERKSRLVSGFLREGHRVKLELFLRGRVKYLSPEFHRERLERLVKLIAEPFRIVDGPKNGPKGLMMVIERDRSGKQQKEEAKETSIKISSNGNENQQIISEAPEANSPRETSGESAG